MDVFTGSIIYSIALASVILAICIYLFFTSTFNYWKDRGVPYVQPVALFGNFKDIVLGRKNLIDVHQDLYAKFEGTRYGGFFEMRKPSLLIRDPDLVQQILIKDFTHFYDRGFPSDPERDPFSGNLFNLEGENWRCLRNKLTPTFTSGKLKGMFEQISKSGEGITKYIEEESKINKSFEGKALMNMFTLDVIASCAFGLQMDKDNELGKRYREIIDELGKPSKFQAFRMSLLIVIPKIARKIGIKSVPKKAEDIIMHIISGTLKYRRENNINRNDFIQLMLNLQKQEQSGITQIAPDEDCDADDDVIDQMKHTYKGNYEKPIQENQKVLFTESCIAAQSFVFLLAGSETVTSPLRFTLYELTQNPEIQKKAHVEIDTVLAKHNNQWSYQVVKEMTYVSQILQETLRKYPVAVSLFRICTQSYKIPDSKLTIEKGTRILIPMHSIHNDPENHKSPQVFDPDRFLNNNFKPNRTYFPFGDGPRICIAMRFAALEMQVILSRILSQYTVKLSSKTKLPLTYEKTGFFDPIGGIWVEFDKRTNIVNI